MPAAPEFDAVVLSEPGDRGLVENDLGDGRELHPLQAFRGALRDRVEAARAIEDIAEEIEAHGRGFPPAARRR